MYTDNSSSAFIRRMKSRTLVGARALNPGLVPGRNSDATGGFMTALDAGRRVEVVPELAEAVANLYSTVPDAPTGVTAIAGVRQAVVSFAVPLNDGRTPITEYTVTSSPGGFTASGSASPITVTDLANGTAYTFTVVATNKMGNSVPSEPSASVTTFNVPSAPRNVTAVRGNQEATVSYVAPLSDGGSPITLYTITSSPDGIVASGTGLSTTITGLTNGTLYTFTVKAINAVGESASSTLTTAVRPASVPNPLAIRSFAPANSTVNIVFEEPEITGYEWLIKYQYSINNGSTYNDILHYNTSGDNVNISISGLTNGQTYNIILRAVSSVGNGSPSQPVSVTPATVPGIPTGVSATLGPGEGQATVSFTAPVNDGGSPITGYIVRSTSGTITVPGSSSPITISGLLNGTTYTFRVTATNSMGSSQQSLNATVTPVGPPDAPTVLSGVGGDKTLYVLFTAGNNGGSPITNYEYSIDGGTTFVACSPAQTSSPIVIADPSLENGTPYTVVLKAVNSAGAGQSSATTTVTPTVNTLRDTNMLIDLDASNTSSYPGSGSTWTNLQSGGLYSGALTGSPTFSSTNGGIITCDGTNDYIEIADADAIRATVGGAITAQIWAKVDPSLTGGDGLISKQYWSPSYDGFSLSLNTNGSLYLKMNGATVDGTYSSPANSYSQGAWALYTIVVRFGGGSVNQSYIYVSPYRVAAGSNADSSIPSITAPLRLAQGIQNNPYNFCPCDIGAFYYYNTALSQEDIIRNYDATKARFGL